VLSARCAPRRPLIETVRKLRIQEPLQVRIGVITGTVGDLVGSGHAPGTRPGSTAKIVEDQKDVVAPRNGARG
jgi:class 3 adenylate cyclase